MVIILDGNSEHVAHAWRIKKTICDCSRSNKMHLTELKQRLLLTCPPISELPYNITTVLKLPLRSFLEFIPENIVYKFMWNRQNDIFQRGKLWTTSKITYEFIFFLFQVKT